MRTLDVLIPTYNRSRFLRLNLLRLAMHLKADLIADRVTVIVRDNHSSDDTRLVVSECASLHPEIQIKYYCNSENMGLEKNVVAVLSDATLEYVLFLGDDDFLPSGYMKKVLDIIDSDPATSFIVPGFGELWEDGRFQPHRQMQFAELSYQPGIESIRALSKYGHQLSGLVFKRAGLLEAYLENAGLRNLYPFIHFACKSMRSGRSYFVPRFLVIVWCGNSKDWSYDDSGLLTEAFKSYKGSLRGFDVAQGQLSFLLAQTWRMRFSVQRPIRYLKAVWHVLRDGNTHMFVKLCLLIVPVKVIVDRCRKDRSIAKSESRKDLLSELGI